MEPPVLREEESRQTRRRVAAVGVAERPPPAIFAAVGVVDEERRCRQGGRRARRPPFDAASRVASTPCPPRAAARVLGRPLARAGGRHAAGPPAKIAGPSPDPVDTPPRHAAPREWRNPQLLAAASAARRPPPSPLCAELPRAVPARPARQRRADAGGAAARSSEAAGQSLALLRPRARRRGRPLAPSARARWPAASFHLAFEGKASAPRPRRRRRDDAISADLSLLHTAFRRARATRVRAAGLRREPGRDAAALQRARATCFVSASPTRGCSTRPSAHHQHERCAARGAKVAGAMSTARRALERAAGGDGGRRPRRAAEPDAEGSRSAPAHGGSSVRPCCSPRPARVTLPAITGRRRRATSHLRMANFMRNAPGDGRARTCMASPPPPAIGRARLGRRAGAIRATRCDGEWRARPCDGAPASRGPRHRLPADGPGGGRRGRRGGRPGSGRRRTAGPTASPLAPACWRADHRPRRRLPAPRSGPGPSRLGARAARPFLPSPQATRRCWTTRRAPVYERAVGPVPGRHSAPAARARLHLHCAPPPPPPPKPPRAASSSSSSAARTGLRPAPSSRSS